MTSTEKHEQDFTLNEDRNKVRNEDRNEDRNDVNSGVREENKSADRNEDHRAILMTRLKRDGKIESNLAPEPLVVSRQKSCQPNHHNTNSSNEQVASYCKRLINSIPFKFNWFNEESNLRTNSLQAQSSEQTKAFNVYKQSLLVNSFERAICLLTIGSIGFVLIGVCFLILMRLASNQDSHAAEEEPIVYLITISCAIQLLILVFVIVRLIIKARKKQEEQMISQEVRSVNVDLSASNMEGLREKYNISKLQLTLLISSPALSSLLAISNKKLVIFQPTTMFIVYTLLAVDTKKAFIVTFVANLIHLASFSFAPTTTTPPPPPTNETINPTTTLKALTWFQLTLIVIVYSFFHAIGFYLNKETQNECKESFDDIQSHVSSKIMMDAEDKKLTKLMESVIPKHLAGRMREDILNENKGRFNNIYLECHNRVSILFADIVNFTKISSNLSAQLLVETLNELFGRFDKAADRNHCLRIKILGDCYYCISGIPADKSGQHAKRSVEMGLDMIDILGDLAQDNSGVDLNMRVGIHSGRVLCGILGKKKWQFDVHSNDVKLANHTEQSGIPGRVHITEDTLEELDGHYEVELANGHKRDTYIAQQNITTYFVIPPANRRASLKSFSLPSSSSIATSSTTKLLATNSGAKMRFILAGKRLINALHFIRTIDAPFANLDTQGLANNDRIMRETIASRSKIHDDIHRITLKFKNSDMGELYAKESTKHQSLQRRRLVIYFSSTICLLILASQTSSFEAPSSTKVHVCELAWVLEVLALFLVSILVYFHQTEYNARRDFLWSQVAIKDREKMAEMGRSNRSIFFNLLPPHVASYFLKRSVTARSHMELYHKSHERIGVVFATISNFSDFYSEELGNNLGLECLRLLNEIICDFDSILDDDRFKAIDKIKTIGSTYMAAIGLFPDYELPSGSINSTQTPISSPTSTDLPTNSFDTQPASHSQETLNQSLAELETRREIAQYLQILVHFVFQMRARLEDINQHCYNCFTLRAGINLGPVTAGVIGANKPQYDIWGNTVNVASRMESTAEPNKIQITDEVHDILKDFNEKENFSFTCRGRINVKGKGFMTTYYLDYPSPS